MGSSSLGKWNGKWIKDNFPEAYRDLCTSFIDRGFSLSNDQGYSAMVTMQSWMFLGSYEKLRGKLLRNHTISSMAHLGTRAFGAIGGEVVSTTATVFANKKHDVPGTYLRLVDMQSEEAKREGALEALADPNCGWCYVCDSSSFAYVSGSPILYWAPQAVFDAFENMPEFGTVADARVGLITGDVNRFLKRWAEVSLCRISFGTKPGFANDAKWVPCTKGGEYRLWYGNNEFVMNWENDGWEMKNDNFDGDRVRAHNFNGEQAFKEGISWSTISSASFHCRYVPQGFMFDTAGPFCEIVKPGLLWYSIGFMSSSMYRELMGYLNPTMNFPPGYLQMVPFCESEDDIKNVSALAKENVALARKDWDSFESSWDYSKHPLI